jgi:hypothetical protein
VLIEVAFISSDAFNDARLVTCMLQMMHFSILVLDLQVLLEVSLDLFYCASLPVRNVTHLDLFVLVVMRY